MDIEEQIEKAEKLDTPSLVGLSIRSADDLVHQNYIHPEKYKGRSKSKPKKHLILDLSVGASLDDLINEGALLGSEEDFDKFLDDTGKIKSDAKYAPEKKKPQEESSSESTPQKEATKAADEPLEPQVKLGSVDPESVPISALSTVDNDKTEPKEDLIYENDNFSAPNLSEYQLDHQIADHSDLLSSVQSYDLSKLPSSNDRERSKSNNLADLPARVPSNTRASPARRAPALGKHLDFGENANIRLSDSLHSPYFASYERSPSRSRTGFRDKSTDRDTRLKSSTTSNPHLARGDTYKNIHPDTPLKYERPADFDVDEEEEDSRATRHSKPTMGESIAAAEEENLKAFHGEQGLTRDPSLVTTGDYTNFNVDTVNRNLDEASLYSVRSESSTNYLRSISRSRSRQPRHNVDSINEKNDANHEELAQEGALISDDPFDQVEDLDNVMKNAVSPSKKQDASDIIDAQKKPAEKAPSLAETSITEDAEPKATDALTSEEIEEESKDISKEDESSGIPLSKESHLGASSEDTSAKEAVEEESEKAPVSDVAAEEKDAETKEQLIDESAPTVTAEDIKIDDLKADHEVHRDIAPEVSEEAPESSESVEIDELAEDKIKEAKEQLIAEEAPTVTAADIKLDKNERKEVDESTEDALQSASEKDIKDDEPSTTALESSTKSIVQEADEPLEKASAKALDTSAADDETAGTTKSKEFLSDDEETKPNLVSEPVANVTDKEEAKDIKAEEDPTPEDKDSTEEEEPKPSLIAEGGIEEDEPVAEPEQKLDESVDEEGNSVEKKSETVKEGVETDKHGAKVPVIDFDKEKENVAPETDAPATQPSLIGETANDDKELEAEDAEAAEATTGKDVAKPATVVEKERSKYDSEEDKTIEPASETALPKEAVSTEPETSKELKKDEGDVVEEDAPETEGEIVDIKNDDVPTDSQKVKATEIVAEEEEEKQASGESAEQKSEVQDLEESAEASTEKTTKDAEEEEAAETAKEETTKDADEDAVDVSTKDVKEELPKSEKTTTAPLADVKDDSEVKDKEVVQEKSTPQAASQGWFGLIKQGLGAVVGGGAAAAAADTKKDDEFGVSQEELRKHLQSLPVYIYTSLAGGMQIMQRTNRLTTILQANGVKFEYKDLGTDEEAKKIWRRYALGKTLPGVVRGDDFIGNWQEVDELNEEYMLTQRLWEEL